MTININEDGNAIVAVLNGRLDTAASTEVVGDFQKLIEKANKNIVIDCTDMSYISSSGLRLFLSLRKASMAAGGSVVIRNISDEIRSVFTMTGFLNLFTIE